MAYIEYPKFLYRGEGEARDSVRVTDADGEAAAVADGYEALPSAQPDSLEVQKAQPTYLEYPKHVYRCEGDARESIVVANAEQETAAAADGYAPVSAPAEPEPEPEPPAAGKGGKTRKAKA